MESTIPINGNFRVIIVDTFDGIDYSRDFDTLIVAQSFAQIHSGTMLKSYIYDKDGTFINEYGIF